MSECVFASEQETERLKRARKKKVTQVDSEKDAFVIINCQDISRFLSHRYLIFAVTYTLE